MRRPSGGPTSEQPSLWEQRNAVVLANPIDQILGKKLVFGARRHRRHARHLNAHGVDERASHPIAVARDNGREGRIPIPRTVKIAAPQVISQISASDFGGSIFGSLPSGHRALRTLPEYFLLPPRDIQKALPG